VLFRSKPMNILLIIILNTSLPLLLNKVITIRFPYSACPKPMGLHLGELAIW